MKDLHVEIRGAEKLSFRERQVVVLKEMGYPAAIARRRKLSPSSVATLFNRARQKGYEVVIVLPGGLLLPDEEELADGGEGGEQNS